MKRPVVLLLSFLGPASAVQGAVFTFDAINTLIPDGKGSGLVNGQTLLSSQISGQITGLTLSLTISGVGTGGAYNGDLYATLQHDSGFSVLLNRPGKTGANPWGYGDNGLALTFSDTVAAPDVHTYRTTLGGAPAGALTGTWSTDGRTADPALVTDDPATRTTALTDFFGLAASGQWTLFVADLEAGGQARLDSWSLSIDVAPVPEPGAWALVGGLGLVAFALWRRGR